MTVRPWRHRGELVDLFAEPGFDSPIGLFIIPDLKNPTRYALYASQGGLQVLKDVDDTLASAGGEGILVIDDLVEKPRPHVSLITRAVAVGIAMAKLVETAG